MKVAFLNSTASQKPPVNKIKARQMAIDAVDQRRYRADHLERHSAGSGARRRSRADIRHPRLRRLVARADRKRAGTECLADRARGHRGALCAALRRARPGGDATARH